MKQDYEEGSSRSSNMLEKVENERVEMNMNTSGHKLEEMGIQVACVILVLRDENIEIVLATFSCQSSGLPAVPCGPSTWR